MAGAYSLELFSLQAPGSNCSEGGCGNSSGIWAILLKTKTKSGDQKFIQSFPVTEELFWLHLGQVCEYSICASAVLLQE